MSKEKQIKEMARALCKYSLTEYCASGNCTNPNCPVNARALEILYNAGYRKQSEGEWLVKWRSTFPQYEPSEYQCSICGYVRTVKHKFCPNCGAKMKGV